MTVDPGSLGRLWRRFAHQQQLVLSVLAVLIGILVAYAAIGFRLALEGVQWLAYGFGGEAVYSKAAALPWWQLLLVPSLGGLLIGIFITYMLPGRRPQAVAQVIEASALRNGRMSFRHGVYAAAVSAASLGVGASAGREGPMVHFGAVLASAVAQRLQLSANLSRIVLACGVAAAVSASFNAPIAGVFFALEVVVGHYALSTMAPVVIASVAGTVVSRAHLGALPAFAIPEYEIVSVLEFPAFVLLGVVCAAVAAAFMWSIFVAEDVMDRSPVPDWLKPAAGGLAVGAVAVWFPHVLGVGYEATDAALKALLPLWLLMALIVLKTAATAISLGCRFGGGVFSPALFIGAMIGGSFGTIAAIAFPELASGQGAYALVGMSAFAAPVLGAPISTILIVFELTGDYRMTIAVMVATVTSSLLIEQFIGKSYFHWQLARRGLNLRGGRARHLLQLRQVGDIMAHDFVTVPEHMPLREIKRALSRAPAGGLLVVDGQERLVAAISFADLKEVVFEPGLEDLVNARDIARADPPVLMASDTLEQALALMDVKGEEQIAVVDDLQDRRVAGVAHYRDVLRAYNKALLEAQAEEHDERRA